MQELFKIDLWISALVERAGKRRAGIRLKLEHEWGTFRLPANLNRRFQIILGFFSMFLCRSEITNDFGAAKISSDISSNFFEARNMAQKTVALSSVKNSIHF